MMYTIKNKITGEMKQFKSFYDFNDWYKRLTIAEMMSWSGWYLSERSGKYVPVSEKVSS